jgi:hypothetical protein
VVPSTHARGLAPEARHHQKLQPHNPQQNTSGRLQKKANDLAVQSHVTQVSPLHLNQRTLLTPNPSFVTHTPPCSSRISHMPDTTHTRAPTHSALHPPSPLNTTFMLHTMRRHVPCTMQRAIMRHAPRNAPSRAMHHTMRHHAPCTSHTRCHMPHTTHRAITCHALPTPHTWHQRAPHIS